LPVCRRGRHAANAQQFALNFASASQQRFDLCQHVEELHIHQRGARFDCAVALLTALS
jgi:hypothetical protein